MQEFNTETADVSSWRRGGGRTGSHGVSECCCTQEKEMLTAKSEMFAHHQ